MRGNKVKKVLYRVLPIAFYVALVLFLLKYLSSIDLNVIASVQINFVFIAIAIVLGLFFRYWGTYIWVILLRGLGAKDVRYSRGLIYVYAKSWLGRYIPGTAPWILGKIYFASKHGISKVKLGISSLLEGGLQIVVLMVLSLLMLSTDSRLDIIDPGIKLMMAIVATIGILVLIPSIFNRFIRIIYRVFKRKTLEEKHPVSGKVIAKGAALYTIGALVAGFSLFFIAKAVYPELPYNQMLFVMAVGNLAGAASMLAIFAPSGIGVREGIQLVLLSLIMPTELALIITILTRLIGVLTDLIFFAISYASTKAGSRV